MRQIPLKASSKFGKKLDKLLIVSVIFLNRSSLKSFSEIKTIIFTFLD